jgi:2-keto-4-pentenoate hydratase
MIDADALAAELVAACDRGLHVKVPPTTRDPSFNLDAAYAVEAAVVRRRRAEGWRPVGLKVGYANRALWRLLRLTTLVWAHVYDRTVHPAADNRAHHALTHRVQPRLEPEIVFKLRDAPPAGAADAATSLAAVEWIALGFEVNDCVFLDWKYQPADFVAAFGFHTALIIGTPIAVTPERLPALVDALARFAVRLSRDGTLVEEGSARNVLKSPALCLAELATAVAARPGTGAFGPGALVSTGTLTASQPVGVGETWTAEVDDVLGLPALTVAFGV